MEIPGGDIFRDFADRDADLRGVTRYSLYDVMFYRSNLYTHSHRVAALVKVINPLALEVFGYDYDPNKAALMAHVHDDAEIIFGDVQAGNKSKMTADQLKEVEAVEARAIEEISKRFPETVGGYNYRQLIEEYAGRSSLEALVINFADKYDGMGEALHELFAGNHVFNTNVVNEYGRIPTATQHYAAFFRSFPGKFPMMGPLLESSHAIFVPVVDLDYDNVVAYGKPHTMDTLGQPTGNHYYDVWLGIVLTGTNDEVVRELITQKEFV